MAPRTATPKNKHHGKNTINSPGKPRAEQTDYAQQQEDEIEVLRSIYMEDFTDLETKAAWGNKKTNRAFELRLKPMMQNEVDVCVSLSVRLTATYPKSLPDLKLQDAIGVRPAALNSLNEFTAQKSKELLGEVMIYEIASGIQEILEDEARANLHRESLPTFEEQRAAQEIESARLAEQEKKLALEHQSFRKAEEDRVLQQMLEDEIQRQDARKKPRSTPAKVFKANCTPDVLRLDRPIVILHDGETIEFTATTQAVKFASGPLTALSTVQPLTSQPAPLIAVKLLTIHEPAAKVKSRIINLEEELEMLRKIQHPNVLNVHDFRITFQDNSTDVLIFLEYARRGSLGDQLAMNFLPAAKIRIWTVELLEAIDYLHKNGIIHKRVHLNNILLKASGGSFQAILADAGYQDALYGIGNAAQKDFKSFVSAYWRAPEGSAKTKKTDIWDLGVVFLQMVLGPDTTTKYAGPQAVIDRNSLTAPLEGIIRLFFRSDPKKRPSAFGLIPSEFLRTEADIYDAPLPSRSHRGSTGLAPLTPGQRLRRGSSNVLSATPSLSRYAQEWVELGRLGRGGFGEVVKARNKTDGQTYAVKKIKQKRPSALSSVLSEVMLLGRLNHPYVVRYYTAWPEQDFEDAQDDGETTTETETETSRDHQTGQTHNRTIDFGRSNTGGLDFISSGFPEIKFGSDSGSDSDSDADEDAGSDENETEADPNSDESESQAVESASEDVEDHASGHLDLRRTSSSQQTRSTKSTLYIQMEYCERHTLRDLIRKGINSEEVWRLLRQIVEGLAHIHSLGILHRDLKPDNVFIDMANNPKIGDFGLATSGQLQATHPQAATDNATASDMTRSIGTTYYVAPELRSDVAAPYNDKVDMYSLGIILFEMCFPLHTAMERDKHIREIRQKEHALPPSFHNSDMVVQGGIILSLITHKPSDRPTSRELLASGRIPIKIEDETIQRALETLSDSSSPYYHHMMSALFSHTQSKQIKAHAWDSSAIHASQEASESMLLTRSLVKEHLTDIFKRHGAVECQRPQLIPKSSYYESNANVVQLLDHSGTLVQLPYDLILPHARTIARRHPATNKSFAFGEVFRESVSGGAPYSSGEVDFDIVSRDAQDLALKEAEVIKVLDEIIYDLPAFRTVPMCFHINHADLLDLILEYCKIGTPLRPAVKDQISRLGIHDNNWTKIRNELRSPALAVSATALDELSKFDFRDSPEKATVRLNAIFEGTAFQFRAQACLKHIREVVTYLKSFEVRQKFWLCPLSAINEKFYTGGLLFQCLFDRKRKAVLAAGGRYDKLIDEQKPKAAGALFTGCHAVGFNLSWDKVVISMDKLQQSKNKATSFIKKTAETEQGPDWLPRRCDVVVAAFDNASLRSFGLKILSELWANDISAELAENASVLEDILIKHCADDHGWLVTIKPDTVAGGRPDLRVRNIATRDEAEVKSENLVGHLISELRERDSAGGKSRSQRRQLHSSEENHTSSRTRQNVQVLVAQHRSKKSNKWNIIEAAQTRAQALLRDYSTAPIAAVECRDELIDSIRGTRLSDSESWRRVVHSAAMTEREYVQQIHELLDGYRKRWEEDRDVPGGEGRCRMAFVSNFRTGHVILYDLGL